MDEDALGVAIQQVEYAYDVFNRRIAKQVDLNPLDGVDGVSTFFVYDRENVLFDFVEIDREVILDQRYFHGPQVDQVLAQESGSGEVLWLLGDQLGTIRDLVNSEGVVENHLTYDSYGNVVNETNPLVDTRYAFTGREFDEETGNYYYRARYYDSNIGQFISEDPISFEGGDTNLYRYVFNSPTDSRDPSGLIDEELFKALENRLNWCYQKFGTEKDRFKPESLQEETLCLPAEEKIFNDPFHGTSLKKNPRQWLENFEKRKHLFENVFKDNDTGHENQLKQKCRELAKRVRALEQQRIIEQKMQQFVDDLEDTLKDKPLTPIPGIPIPIIPIPIPRGDFI